MPGPFVPDSTILANVIHQLAITIKAQIPSINLVYEDYPDQSPGDNTVILPLTKYKVLDDTNGKLKVSFLFGARHLFRRRRMSENLALAYSYVNPWLMCISAWPNQDLGGYANQVTIKEGGVSQVSEAGTSMVALITTFDVQVEFNIPLT